MAVHRSNTARRRGQTLLELIGATTVIAIALVPALRIMSDCMKVGRQTETANLLATFSVSKLEEHLVRTAGVWDTLPDDGPVAGYAGLRYRVEKVDEGVGSGLMRITSTVWEDANGNAIWDNNERRSVFATKLARNVSYQQEANGN